MTADNRLMIKNLQKLDCFFTPYSQATSLPYAECDPSTFDDQAYLFAAEEDARAFCEKLNKDCIPVSAVRVGREQMQQFYTGLFLTGINRLVFKDGTDPVFLSLESVVTVKIPEQTEKMPPAVNSALQLTGIYFLQELRRPGLTGNDPARNQKLRDLEQELMADLVRSRFILVLDVTDVKGKLDLRHPDPNLKMPFLKSSSGEILQPVFSDIWEFDKFRQKNPRKLQMMTVPFRNLIPTLVPNASGYLLNPSGFHLALKKEKIELLIQQA